jgi:hypothetical protein
VSNQEAVRGQFGVGHLNLTPDSPNGQAADFIPIQTFYSDSQSSEPNYEQK